MEREFQDMKELISRQLELLEDPVRQDPEEEFIRMIAIRVEELMESNMELFFNHLYRMDVDERKVALALSPDGHEEESVYITIARLIYDRQRKRLDSKRRYKQTDMDFFGED